MEISKQQDLSCMFSVIDSGSNGKGKASKGKCHWCQTTMQKYSRLYKKTMAFVDYTNEQQSMIAAESLHLRDDHSLVCSEKCAKAVQAAKEGKKAKDAKAPE